MHEARSTGGRVSFAVRPYEQHDLEPIVRIWYEGQFLVFKEPDDLYGLEELRLLLEFGVSRTHEIWVAQSLCRSCAIAFVAIRQGCVSQLFVRRSRRRRGVGGLLLEKAKERCPKGLTLTAVPGLVAYYRRHRFSVCGVVPRQAGRLMVRMAWQPGPAGSNPS